MQVFLWLYTTKSFLQERLIHAVFCYIILPQTVNMDTGRTPVGLRMSKPIKYITQGALWTFKNGICM